MPELMTAAEAARVCRISKRTLYRLWGDQAGPAVTRIGGKTFVMRRDLDAWLAAQRSPQAHRA